MSLDFWIDNEQTESKPHFRPLEPLWENRNDNFTILGFRLTVLWLLYINEEFLNEQTIKKERQATQPSSSSASASPLAAPSAGVFSLAKLKMERRMCVGKSDQFWMGRFSFLDWNSGVKKEFEYCLFPTKKLSLSVKPQKAPITQLYFFKVDIRGVSI